MNLSSHGSTLASTGHGETARGEDATSTRHGEPATAKTRYQHRRRHEPATTNTRYGGEVPKTIGHSVKKTVACRCKRPRLKAPVVRAQ